MILENRPNTKRTGDVDVDDYAQTLVEFRAWCDARGLNFRREVSGLVRARMSGGAAPAVVVVRGPVRRRPNHPGNRAPRAPLLACPDFPGRVFTHREVAAACGKAKAYPVSRCVARGRPIPGSPHVFHLATAAEIAAAGAEELAAAAPPAPTRQHRRDK